MKTAVPFLKHNTDDWDNQYDSLCFSLKHYQDKVALSHLDVGVRSLFIHHVPSMIIVGVSVENGKSTAAEKELLAGLG